MAMSGKRKASLDVLVARQLAVLALGGCFCLSHRDLSPVVQQHGVQEASRAWTSTGLLPGAVEGVQEPGQAWGKYLMRQET